MHPIATRLALILALLPLSTLAVGEAHADFAAAQTCAGQLPKDARTIFDASMPALTASANLRDIVTDTTRHLVTSGQIDQASARSSAVAAGECLRLANP